MEIPAWKWEVISMDFITGLPHYYRKFDSIWLIVDELTKSTHFLPVKTTYTAEDCAKLYIKEIVHLHGVPMSIIFYRDAQFTANFWKPFQKSLGTQVNLSTADGQAEKTIQTLKDMLPAIQKIKIIQERLHTAQSRQKSYADVRQRELEFQKCIGDPSRIVPVNDIQVMESLSYEEKPIAILNKQVHRLRTKAVVLVKVLWRTKNREKMTWEAEGEMKSKYAHLFPAKNDAILEGTLQDSALPTNDLQGINSTQFTGETLPQFPLKCA
ncbi:uncharacterized protein LOC132639537 [Lycium barbarum]|uniref:uncharacterized protein LOC132639537 n=1 Tax=Lycium barbarum TaxID=112863 RepID=UPI00293E9572|nr:uncharacterized protein LOC132639537 [Lycium barbarum]